MKIVSNEEFQCYESSDQSWNKGKRITLDGKELISVEVLEDLVHKMEDHRAALMQTEKYNNRFATSEAFGVNWCISLLIDQLKEILWEDSHING